MALDRPTPTQVNASDSRHPVHRQFRATRVAVSRESPMASSKSSGKSPSVFRLVLVPALISLVVTLLRLTGELLAWSESWFNPEAGGFGAIVGITWLAPIFGVYFALELSRTDPAAPRWGKSMALALVAILVLFGFGAAQAPIYMRSYQAGLIFIWVVGLVAAVIDLPAWRALFRTLLVYALGARIPVIGIMFLAIWGNWGTHYDAVPSGFPEMGWFAKFLWLGLFPQLLFWVSFTIVTGMFFGILATGLVGRRKTVPA